MRIFDRKKVRLLFGFTIFFILLILNCVMYCNKAGMKRDLTVVIDVGHGGNDPGKIGVDYVKEKAAHVTKSNVEQGIVAALKDFNIL